MLEKTVKKYTNHKEFTVNLLTTSRETKLQSDLNRKVNDVSYYKYRINIPPEFVNELGWKKSEDLRVTIKNHKLVIEKI